MVKFGRVSLPGDVTRGTIIRFALILIAAVGVLATVAVRQVLDDGARIAAYQQALERSLSDRSRIRKVVSDLRQAVHAQRGYRLTGDAEFLQSYREAVANVPEEIGLLRRSSRGGVNAPAAERLGELAAIVLDRLARGIVGEGAASRPDSARAPPDGVIDGHLADIRSIANGMLAAEDEAIEAGSGAFRQQHAASQSITVGILAAILVLIGVSAALGVAYLEHRRHREAVLREARRRAELARSEAEWESEAKTEFLAVMSHEIRTPLTGILGYTELLLDQSPDPRQSHYLERIETAGSRLLTVANDIYEFSRIESGDVTISPRPFALRSLVDEVVSIASSSARERSLTISLSVSDAIPRMVIGDEAHIKKILLNLLDNAIKFTEKGAITVSVEPDASARVADTIRFTVCDTGIGIPRDKRNLLFRRFSQVDASDRRRHGGIGLGLAIARRLTELMGGEIGVDSEPGAGSRFWVRLPLPGSPAGADTGADTGAAAPAASRAGRILLVEDLEQNRELVQAMLAAAGHDIDVATSGEEAIDAVRSRSYDLVLMDIQMPGMDGIAATRAIRSLDPPRGDVPIVAMTANVLPQQIRAFRKAGMNDHIAKPFHSAEVAGKVARWLGPAAPGVPASAPPQAPGTDGARDDPAALLGPEWVAAASLRLREQLAATFDGRDPRAADPAELARAAHSLVSQAGMLGHAELSRRCSELEEACIEDGNIAEPFARAAAAANRVREAMSEETAQE